MPLLSNAEDKAYMAAMAQWRSQHPEITDEAITEAIRKAIEALDSGPLV